MFSLIYYSINRVQWLAIEQIHGEKVVARLDPHSNPEWHTSWSSPGLDLMFVLSHVPAHTGICNGCVHAQEKHYYTGFRRKCPIARENHRCLYWYIYIFLWGNLSRAIIYFSNSIKERFTNSTREFCNSLFADVRFGLTIRNKLVYV